MSVRFVALIDAVVAESRNIHEEVSPEGVEMRKAV
jgi:hypothetical protein